MKIQIKKKDIILKKYNKIYKDYSYFLICQNNSFDLQNEEILQFLKELSNLQCKKIILKKNLFTFLNNQKGYEFLNNVSTGSNILFYTNNEANFYKLITYLKKSENLILGGIIKNQFYSARNLNKFDIKKNGYSLILNYLNLNKIKINSLIQKPKNLLYSNFLEQGK